MNNWITNTEEQTDAGLMTPYQLMVRYQGQINFRTLANWRSKGEGPRFVKIGSRVFYRQDDVEAWEKRRTLGVKDD